MALVASFNKHIAKKFDRVALYRLAGLSIQEHCFSSAEPRGWLMLDWTERSIIPISTIFLDFDLRIPFVSTIVITHLLTAWDF